MFPDIQAQNRCIAVHKRAVLVSGAFDKQFLLWRYTQPGPTAAKACQRRLGEVLFEFFQTAQFVLNRRGDIARWFPASSGDITVQNKL